MSTERQSETVERPRPPEGVGDAVIGADERGCVTLLSPEAETLTGWTAAEARGKPLLEVLHLVNAVTRRRWQYVPASGLPNDRSADSLSDYGLIIARDGTERRVVAVGCPTQDRAGRVMGLVVRLHDVDQAGRLQTALQESEALVRSISNHLQFIMIYQLSRLPDGSRRFSYVSDSVRQLYGISPEQAMADARLVYSHVHPEDLERVVQEEEEANRTLTAFRTETRMLDPSGRTRWSSFVSTPRLLPDGTTCWDGIEYDITERKRAEEEKLKLQEQLAQARKMESIGQLAGGVAHDFNNMLSVILGNAEMALGTADLPAELRSELEHIRDAAEHSANLTRQLLAFARKQAVAPKVLDLNQTVTETLRMLRHLIGEDIDLAWTPAVELWPVFMDAVQVNQILTNLLINSRDAIGADGRITIETCNAVLDETYCATHPGSVTGEYVTLVVSDNGCGMDNETLAKLFEPFFTTKGLGRGTGLGLATVYGIVKQNRGFVYADSKEGKGTTFRIHLPRHATGVTATAEAPALPMTTGGRETILLVEDEKAILELGQRMLGRLGYTVLAADTADEALRLAEEYPGAIHLLLTDVVMPTMNGRQLAERLQPRRPDLKCLFMSGYAANIVARHGVLEAGLLFLQKPFSKQELDAKVREALARD